jgi:hypothetical protein
MIGREKIIQGVKLSFLPCETEFNHPVKLSLITSRLNLFETAVPQSFSMIFEKFSKTAIKLLVFLSTD